MRTGLIHGIGFNDLKYTTRIPGTKIVCPIYSRWRNMIVRCYSEDLKSKHITYKDCRASENFLKYSYFRDWYFEQVGSSNPKANIDKDLILKGNKIYSEDNCLLLPYEINHQFIKRDNERGDFPIGVTWNKNENVFKAQVNIDGKRTCVARTDCKIEAFMAYKKAKEDYLKVLAERYKSEIDPRAYNALMGYKVEITD